MELAGEVAELGAGAARFAVGDRVMAIVGGGAQAELATVHERQLMPVPAALDWPAAGGLPEVFTTAHDALLTQAQLRPGERLLVHGGAGGVGTAAIQLARALGARVTATVRNERLREQVARARRRGDRPRGLRRARPVRRDPRAGRRAQPGREPEGPRNVGGRIVVIGVAAGAKAELNLLALMGKRARIHGSTLRARPLEEKALTARRVEREVLPLFDAGAAARAGRRDVRARRRAAAYERFAAGGKLGKIVLTLRRAKSQVWPRRAAVDRTVREGQYGGRSAYQSPSTRNAAQNVALGVLLVERRRRCSARTARRSIGVSCWISPSLGSSGRASGMSSSLSAVERLGAHHDDDLRLRRSRAPRPRARCRPGRRARCRAAGT